MWATRRIAVLFDIGDAIPAGMIRSDARAVRAVLLIQRHGEAICEAASAVGFGRLFPKLGERCGVGLAAIKSVGGGYQPRHGAEFRKPGQLGAVVKGVAYIGQAWRCDLPGGG